MILCLETSTDVCSVALVGEEVTFFRRADKGFSHSATLMPLVLDILSEANISFRDLTAVSLSDGPGSYTSLRVGAATCKAVCLAANLPMITVGSLVMLTDQMSKEDAGADYYVGMIDARRDEVYYRIMDGKGNCIVEMEPHILTKTSLDHLEGTIIIGGNGSIKAKAIVINEEIRYSRIIENTADLMIDISKSKLLHKDFVDLAMFSPNYGKKPNITKSSKKVL